MTLRPDRPQKKNGKQKNPCKQRRSKEEVQREHELLHMGDTLPKMSDGTGRTAEAFFPDWKKMGATMKEAVFAAEYIVNGFSATKAYAYTTCPPRLGDPMMANLGADMLRRPVVQALLNEYMTHWIRGKAFEMEHNLMTTLQALAFYDISMFLNPDGTPKFKSWDEIPVEFRRCIEGIEIKFYGKDANQEVVNLTLAKRSEALKAIASYVSILRNGPAASDTARINSDAELVLSAVLNSGRKVDRRTPGQLREEQQKRMEHVREIGKEKREAENQISFSGLG